MGSAHLPSPSLNPLLSAVSRYATSAKREGVDSHHEAAAYGTGQAAEFIILAVDLHLHVIFQL